MLLPSVGYVSQTSEDMVGTRVELLEHLWRTVINASLDASAVENLMAESRKNPDAPFAEAGAAAARMLDAGVSQDDIRLLLRSAAYEAVFGTLYALDDPGVDDDDLLMLHEELLMAEPVE